MACRATETDPPDKDRSAASAFGQDKPFCGRTHPLRTNLTRVSVRDSNIARQILWIRRVRLSIASNRLR